MTDTNKDETFKSYFDYWIEHNFGRGELMQLKQFHDSDISKSRLTIICLNSRIEQLLKNLNQKDKQISEYEQKLMGQVQIIKELQAETNQYKDLWNAEIIYNEKLKAEIKFQRDYKIM